ncbi:hypothetical protein [Prosthecodimorpha staleyi]|uniref:Ig-like domain-containing protein n=1 Tax=Prosthecodimorpha staleyi TaxID=2840188 RepID=A0A947D2C7_9HYPH|nr:hypothetical protein [Prosthecodimorpha staleyi]MBT9289680.1 hypothetical protein [Prosthecodimorpha staleyi]
MHSKIGLATMALGAAVALAAMAAAPSEALAKKGGNSGSGGGGGSSGDVRYTCRATGAPDISMQARWEVKKGRKRFRVEFEAATGGAYTVGQIMTVAVGPVETALDVGSAALEVIGADLVFELGFDSKAQSGGDNLAFPPNFPTITAATDVTVKTGGAAVLGCTLR